MRRGRGLIHSVVTALLVMALLAACGGGDDDDDTGAAASPTTAATSAATSEPTAPTGATDPSSGTADPSTPALGALIPAGGSTFRVNEVATPDTIDAVGEVPEGLRLLAFDVVQIGTSNGDEYNLLYFGLLDESGRNVAIRVTPGATAPGSPGGLLLLPIHPPFGAGVLSNGSIVRGWVHFYAPADSGPLSLAVLDDPGGEFVVLAAVDGAATPASGDPPIVVLPDGLATAEADEAQALGGSIYTVNEVLDPGPTNAEAPAGMRFVTLDIHQEALVDNERINLLDYAVQDTEGYLYPAFFDLGMARPFFPSLDAAAGGMSEGWITFAVREDAELLVVLAKPDFEAGFEPIATFEQD